MTTEKDATADEPLLSTPEAIAHLARLGVRTSRRTLDDLRASGDLPYFTARGRVRILYARDHLAAAFLQPGTAPCPSRSLGAGRAGHTTPAAPSPDSAFMKALALTTGPRPKPGRTGAKPSC